MRLQLPLIGLTIVAALIAVRFLTPQSPWIPLKEITVVSEGAMPDHQMELRLRISGVAAGSNIVAYTLDSGEFTDVFVSHKPLERLAAGLQPAVVQIVEDEVCITVSSELPFEFRLNGEEKLGRWSASELDGDRQEMESPAVN